METTPEMMLVLVNLLICGTGILFLLRGPTFRLRLLMLASGIMSLSQLSSFHFSSGYWASGSFPLAAGHQLLASLVALFALLLLHNEIRDRKSRNRRLTVGGLALPMNTPAGKASKGYVSQPAGLHKSSGPA